MRLSRMLCACCLLFAFRARAGKWAQQCQQASKSSADQCQAAFDGYKAADSVASNAGGQASGTNINKNSGISSGVTSGLSGQASSAISQCEAAKKECESRCDSAKQGAQGDAQSQIQSIRQQGIQDLGQIPGIKSGQCQAPIDKNISGLQQAKAADDKATKEANDTKKESNGGGAPPGSSPSSGDKSSDNGTSSGQTTQTALNCAVAGGSRFSDCNATFTAKCTASMTASECDQFTDRYCNTTSTTSTAATPLATATTNLVIDQKGEGVGSNYCAFASSYRFCQMSGREQCLSCQRLVSQQSCGDPSQCLAQSSDREQSKQRAACPDDPIYVTGGWTTGAAAASGAAAGAGGTSSSTTALATSASAASAAGAGGAGGGALGSGATAGGESASSGDSNREGLPNGLVPASAGAGADGGGGSGASWIAESERAPAADVRKLFEGRKPTAAAPMAGMPGDVSNSLGPSLFTIGSGGIHSFCLRSRVSSCGR